MILIKGTFHVIGLSPDGDSVRFRADRKSNWRKIEDTYHVEVNGSDCAQLRFEGIDAPETHFQGNVNHQPLEWAHGARDFTLAHLGIRDAVWGPTESRVTSAIDGTRGYIVSRMVERNRRPVSFVFAGTTSKSDGATVYFDVMWMKQSLNYKLLRAGLAYPTYYDTLYYDLRDAMSSGAVDAFNNGSGLWPYDRSSGVNVTSLNVIREQHTIFPKLFRRLVEYMRNRSSMSGFKSWLEEKQERVLILSRGQTTHFDTVIEQQGNRISMTVEPEDLVFDPRW